MNYRKSINKRKRKRSNRSNRSKRSKRSKRQSGGFIGTMFDIALKPVKMISKPVMNKLSSMMSNSNNSNSNNSNSNSNNISSGSISGGGSVDGGTLNNIRMNNSHINTLKQLSSYGYDNRTLTSYISQLQHINL
jgi:hypothetical protein